MMYPSLKWIKKELKNNIYSRVSKPVLAAYVVGSYARKKQKLDSDIDIAVIIPKQKRVSSLKVSENYHNKIPTTSRMSHYKGKRVDFQFFYPDDPELKGYRKIKIKGE